MKLVIAIVQDTDAPGLTKALLERGFQSTKLASTGVSEGGEHHLAHRPGGREGSRGAGAHQGEVPHPHPPRLPGPPFAEAPDPFLAQPVEVQVGGAVVFVLPVEHFVKL